MPTQNATIILLGTDTQIGLAVIRDLGRHGYEVVGIGRTNSALGWASRYCTRHYVRERDEVATVNQIEALAARHGASFLLAISEADLLMINRNRRKLEPIIKPLVPTAKMLSEVLDKVNCQRHAAALGIKTAELIVPSSLDAAKTISQELTYPVILKWADPNAISVELAAAGLNLHKAQFARNPFELMARLQPYETIGRFPLVQSYCPGKGVGHMFLTVNGETLVEFQHERLHEWPPEGGVSTLCRAVPLSEHVEVREKSKQLMQRLQWTGVAMVEYRYDSASRDFCFMEINGRFWGSLPLAIEAGIPFASGLVAVTGEGKPVPEYACDYPRIHSLFWVPETKRILRLLFQSGSIHDPHFEINRLGEFIAYVRYLLDPRTRFFIFSWQDPLPFFVDIWNAIRKIGKSTQQPF